MRQADFATPLSQPETGGTGYCRDPQLSHTQHTQTPPKAVSPHTNGFCQTNVQETIRPLPAPKTTSPRDGPQTLQSGSPQSRPVICKTCYSSQGRTTSWSLVGAGAPVSPMEKQDVSLRCLPVPVSCSPHHNSHMPGLPVNQGGGSQFCSLLAHALC